MIIATAGHVDHGKSTLVHCLTGTHPDRWQEERDRGLTIDLGFAWTTLPSGRVAGFVDVPGHHRFLANMLAGCGAIDGVLLAVSAREGWKPQTEEHVQILHHLGAPTGMVALTFADTVDVSDLARVTAEVADRLRGTFLEGAPVVPTAAGDRAAVDGVRATLDRAITVSPTALDVGRPRLWIDRSFVLAGPGRVVTGTLTGGRFTPGERVMVTDGESEAPARIRSIQSFGEHAPVAKPGTRIALGLRVDGPAPARGSAVVHARQWTAGRHLHVALAPVRGHAQRPPTRGAYLVYIGTASAPTRLAYPASAGHAAPGPEGPEGPEGQTTVARLHLAHPVGPVTIGDRVILRDAGRDDTAGGGTIIAVDSTVVRYPPEQIARRLAAAGQPVARRPARIAAALLAERDGTAPQADVERATGRVRPVGTRVAGDVVVAVPALRGSRRVVAGRLARSSAMTMPTGRLERLAARSLVARRLAVERDGVLHHRSSDPAAARNASRDHLQGAVRDGRLGHLFTPDEARQAADTQRRDLRHLIDHGDLIEIGPYLTTTTDLDALVRTVTGTLAAGPATAAELKRALGLTRKHAIPLLEALDRRGITRREGDRRELA